MASTFSSGTLMILSRYLTTFPAEEQPDLLILFSTRNASKVRLSREKHLELEAGLASPDDEAVLSGLGMMVDDREAERQFILKSLDTVNETNPLMTVTAVLTLDCNFSCIYCFEGNLKGPVSMSDDTADQLIRFIERRFKEPKKSLAVNFYGGEPLLNLRHIRLIARSLLQCAERRGAAFGFSLTTNGSLLTRGVVKELVPLGLRSARVTLDGPAGNHNRYRPYRSGAGSFDGIVRNIKETGDLVTISLGGNYEEHNYRQFVLLLDELIQQGLGPDVVPNVKFDPVAAQPKDDMALRDFHGGCLSRNEPWVLEADALLREALLERGYGTAKVTPQPCMVDIQDFYVVHFNGEIYRCPAFIGKKQYVAGHIVSGPETIPPSYSPGIWKNEECLACCYLPLCYGGCRYLTYLRTGRTDTLDCQRSFFDQALETLVKQDLKYGAKAESS
ncbi:geopeptide radical SAM maturase [Thermodesulfobacteriota bacterium]